MANTIIVKDLLQAEVIRRKDRLTVIKQVANTKYQGELRKQGNTVTVQQFPLLSGNVGGTAGDDITLSDWAIADHDLVVSEVYQNGAIVKDIEEVQSNLMIRGQIASSFAKSSDINEDQYISSLTTQAYSANKLNNQAPLTLSTSNTYSAVTSMSRALAEANDEDMMKMLFVSPAIKQAMKLEGILNSTDIGLEMRLRGEIGEIDGFRVMETRNLTKVRILTMDTKPTADDTLTIQGRVKDTVNGGLKDEDIVWTFVASATSAGDVAIGANVAASQANLIAAINGTGTEGTGTYVDVSAAKRTGLKNALVKIGAFASDIATIQSAFLMSPTETFTASTNIFGAEAELMFATGNNAINYVSQLDQTKIADAEGGFRSNILQERVYGGAILGDNAKGIVTSEIATSITTDLN